MGRPVTPGIYFLEWKVSNKFFINFINSHTYYHRLEQTPVDTTGIAGWMDQSLTEEKRHVRSTSLILFFCQSEIVLELHPCLGGSQVQTQKTAPESLVDLLDSFKTYSAPFLCLHDLIYCFSYFSSVLKFLYRITGCWRETWAHLRLCDSIAARARRPYQWVSSSIWRRRFWFCSSFHWQVNNRVIYPKKVKTVM